MLLLAPLRLENWKYRELSFQHKKGHHQMRCDCRRLRYTESEPLVMVAVVTAVDGGPDVEMIAVAARPHEDETFPC